MPLPTLAAAHAYVTEHGLQELLQSAVNACIQANAADPIGFLIEHLKAVKEAAVPAAAGAVAEEEKSAAAVVPAVTSEFDKKLCMAAVIGHLEQVEALLAKGANVKAGTFWEDPLHTAADGGSATVDTLLAHGADAGGGRGWGTPLHVVA